MIWAASYAIGLLYFAGTFVLARRAIRQAIPDEKRWPWWANLAAAIVCVFWPLAVLSEAAKGAIGRVMDRVDELR
jgi:hypothetical protein